MNDIKLKIATEFIDKYLAWLEDHNGSALTDTQYGRKYGFSKKANGEPYNDTQATMLFFQSHIYAGRYIDGWVEAGYSKEAIYSLHHDGFLSMDYKTGWQARQLHRSYFYYINQNRAKNIYKAYRKGFFNKKEN